MGLKKWFMVQVWRLQQIAMVGSLILLVVNLALTLYGYVRWRLPNPYMGVPLVALVLIGIIWGAAWVWDRHLKLWREQQTVMVDRNQYAGECLNPKEAVLFEWSWIPMVEKADPKMADNLRAWLRKQYLTNPPLREAAAEIKESILRGKT